MTVREFNARYLERIAIALMVIGVIALCQPWIAFLHAWSVLITLIGIIAFNIAAHIPPPVKKVDEDDAGAVSVDAVVHEGRGHG